MIFDDNLPFCKFRIPVNSGRVIWEVTNECNYACSYCIFASTGRKPFGELIFNEIHGTLLQLKIQNFTHIKFTGGEPFLRVDMIDILELAIELGFMCDISTNASRITPEIAKRLKLLNMEFIHVSIDGHTEHIHQAVRGKKSFSPTIKGIESLVNAGLNVRVGCVIHAYNEYYIKEMIQFFNTIKAASVVFSLMEPVGRMRGKNANLATRPHADIARDIEQYQKDYDIKVTHHFFTSQEVTLYNIKNYSKQKSQNTIDYDKNLCPAGTRFLFINSIGIVSPCTWVSEHQPELILGNIKEKSLSTLLMSENMTKLYHIKEASKNNNICPMDDTHV